MKKLTRIGIDCETWKTQPGLLVPRLVCLTWACGDQKGIRLRDDAIAFARQLLEDSNVEIAGHRVFYDLAVLANEEPRLLPLIFKKIEQNQVKDTLVRQQLIDIAAGDFEYFDGPDGKRVKNKHSLAQYTLRHFGVVLQKGDDSWQLRFAELDGVPLEKWPPGAVDYALSDAEYALAIADKQDIIAGAPIPTELLQTKSAFALHLMGIHGLRTSPEKTEALAKQWFREREEIQLLLKKAGVMRSDGTKDLKLIKKLVEKAYGDSGRAVPMSESGKNISTDRDTLAESGDPVLVAISKHNKVDKYIGTYLPVMRQASVAPFNPPWNVLVTSGRTSCGSEEAPGNVQNLPRFGGVRECYIPAYDYFCSTDLDTAELRSWAEVCLQRGIPSKLAEELNADLDPHLAFGAGLGEISYEEIERRYKDKDKDAKNLRQLAKVPNFGLPGGLGAGSFVDYAKNYGITLTFEKAKELIRKWKRHYYEAPKYFDWIHRITDVPKPTIVHPITGFVRGDVNYTAACNHMFQHLTAMCSKDGLYRIVRECYTGESEDGSMKKSPLKGCRPASFVHDEVVTDMKKDRAHEAAHRQAELMIEGSNVYIKKVKNKCTPALSEYMSKDADPVYDESGRLVPWYPKKV